MRALILLGLAVLMGLSSAKAHSIHVVFINPGVSRPTGPTGAFWHMVSSFMEACAEDLQIDLKVLYAEREYVRMLSLAREAIAQDPAPDYLVLVNEKLIAGQLLEITKNSNIPVLLLLNDLTARQKAQAGRPREKFKNWIGSVIPDNRHAGRLLADYLIKHCPGNETTPCEMIAINGNRATPAAVERESGLREAVARQDRSVLLRQVTYGEWREDQGYLKAKVLLQRYPQVTLIWTANDPMGFGALRAARELGRTPGHDVLVTALNWSQRGIEAVKAGTLAADVGGHFMLGGWALVMLYDYHHGIDFADFGGTEQTIKVFNALDVESVREYTTCFGNQDWEKIDFTRFSKVLNPGLGHLSFALSTVLEECSAGMFDNSPFLMPGEGK